MTTEQMDAFAEEHGPVALLDHLGLDGWGNYVTNLQTIRGACEQIDWYRLLDQAPLSLSERRAIRTLNEQLHAEVPA
jgi:hypothetical protein